MIIIISFSITFKASILFLSCDFFLEIRPFAPNYIPYCLALFVSVLFVWLVTQFFVYLFF